MAQSYSNFGGSSSQDRRNLYTMTSTFVPCIFYQNGRDINASVDDNGINGWFIVLNTPVTGASVRFDLLCAPRIIDKVRVHKNGGGTLASDVYQWQGGDGAGNWTNLGPTFDLSPSTSPIEIDLGNSTPYQAYRMLGVSGLASNWNLDFEFSIDDTVSAGYLDAKIGATLSRGNATNLTTTAITTTRDSWLVLAFWGEHPTNAFNITSITDTAGLTWTKRSQLKSVTTNAKCDAEFWYARMSTPGSTTITVNTDLGMDDIAYNVLAFAGLPDMSTPWKSDVTGGTYHNDTATAATPTPAISYSGLGLCLINGGSPKNNRPSQDEGYGEGMGISSFANNGGNQWCWSNMSAAIINNPSSRTIAFRGTVHDYSVLVDAINLGTATIPDTNLDIAFSDGAEDALTATPTIASPADLGTVALSDGSEDKLTATITVVGDVALSAAFSDGPEEKLTVGSLNVTASLRADFTDGADDAMLTWGSFYPVPVIQSIAIVKGR